MLRDSVPVHRPEPSQTSQNQHVKGSRRDLGTGAISSHRQTTESLRLFLESVKCVLRKGGSFGTRARADLKSDIRNPKSFKLAVNVPYLAYPSLAGRPGDHTAGGRRLFLVRAEPD